MKVLENYVFPIADIAGAGRPRDSRRGAGATF
jgi:hypothetical protein